MLQQARRLPATRLVLFRASKTRAAAVCDGVNLCGNLSLIAQLLRFGGSAQTAMDADDFIPAAVAVLRTVVTNTTRTSPVNSTGAICVRTVMLPTVGYWRRQERP